MRRRTNYACLSQSYYRDDALTSCHPLAELLFVRSIAFSREQLSNGYITDAQLTHYVSVRIPHAQKHAKQLVERGLWTRTEGGYMVRSFLEWNSSDAEIEAERERDRKRKASGRNPDGVPTESAGTPEGIRRESLDREEKRREEKELPPAPPPRADVEHLCRRLADAIEGNGCKRPTITEEWRTSARLLLDRDGRPLEEALRLVAWCQTDSFWRTNVLSMPTFRKQYDRLRLKSGDGPPAGLEPRTGPKAEWR